MLDRSHHRPGVLIGGRRISGDLHGVRVRLIRQFCLVGALPSCPLLSDLLTSGGYVVVTHDVDLAKEPAVATKLSTLKPMLR